MKQVQSTLGYIFIVLDFPTLGNLSQGHGLYLRWKKSSAVDLSDLCTNDLVLRFTCFLAFSGLLDVVDDENYFRGVTETRRHVWHVIHTTGNSCQVVILEQILPPLWSQ
jgi:hypothetical protein